MKKILTGFILSLFLIQNVFAAIPYTFTNGVVADATEVNSNFNYFEGKFSTTSGHAHTGSDSKTLSTLGTITSGTWQATVIDEVYGGTGLSSYASGDLIYATSDTGLARLAKGAIGSVLSFGATRSEPEWIAPGTAGNYLKSQGVGVNPIWAAGAKTVQVVNTQTSVYTSGTTVMPLDNTIPQNTEGTEFITLAITPTSATNKLKIDVVFNFSVSANTGSVALFQDSTVNALIANSINPVGASSLTNMHFTYYMTAGTTSATTFKLRGGTSAAGTFVINGDTGATYFGGVYYSSMTITEYIP